MKKLLTLALLVAASVAPFALPAAPSSGVARAQDAHPSRVTLHIDGMTCASCSLTVRVTLERLDGVRDAVVSVAQKRARVVYDPAQVTPRQMVDAVNRAGYRARVASEPGS